MTRGDIIHTSFGRERGFEFILMVDEYSGSEQPLTYLFRCTVDGKMDMCFEDPIIGVGTQRKDRKATPQEVQILLESFSKNMEKFHQEWVKVRNTPPPMFEILLEKILK